LATEFLLLNCPERLWYSLRSPFGGHVILYPNCGRASCNTAESNWWTASFRGGRI